MLKAQIAINLFTWHSNRAGCQQPHSFIQRFILIEKNVTTLADLVNVRTWQKC